MSVSAVSGGSGVKNPLSQLWRQQQADSYFAKINDKYSLKLRMKQGNYRSLTPLSDGSSKVSVFMNSELLFEASQDEKLGDQLWDKAAQFAELHKALEERFSGTGNKLSESGIVVDKRGDIFIKGKGTLNDKESTFNIKLCNVRDRFAELPIKLTREFDRQTFGTFNLFV